MVSRAAGPLLGVGGRGDFGFRAGSTAPLRFPCFWMAHWIGLAQHGHDVSVRNFVGEELLELVELALEGGVDLDVNGIGVLGHRADRGTRLRKRRRTGPPGRALAASPSHFSEGWFGGAPARLSALGAARGGLPGLVLAADAAAGARNRETRSQASFTLSWVVR